VRSYTIVDKTECIDRNTDGITSSMNYIKLSEGQIIS